MGWSTRTGDASGARRLAVAAALTAGCIVETTPSGGYTPMTGTRGCNEIAASCGCWGYHDGRPHAASVCASGFAVPSVCAGYCPAGGSPYATVCTCDAPSTPDAGAPIARDAGAPGDAGPSRCDSIQGNSRTLGAPAIACGAPGELTLRILTDINTFWQSQMTPCACDLPSCPFNAWVLGQTPGYVYYRRDFLQWISQAGGGAAIGAAWMLSHEAGHNLQVASGLRYSSMKAQELGADCLSGYFLAWLECSGRSNMTDMMAAAGAICAAGDPQPSGWFDPGTHGTCNERIAAVQRGAAGYRGNQRPAAVCVF